MGIRVIFSDDLLSKKLFSSYDSNDLFFYIGMEALDGKRLCVSQSVFRLNIFVRAAAWGWEHFGRIVRMGAIFF